MTAPSAVPSVEALQAAVAALADIVGYAVWSATTQRFVPVEVTASAAVAAALPHLTAQLRAEIAEEDLLRVESACGGSVWYDDLIAAVRHAEETGLPVSSRIVYATPWVEVS